MLTYPDTGSMIITCDINGVRWTEPGPIVPMRVWWDENAIICKAAVASGRYCFNTVMSNEWHGLSKSPGTGPCITTVFATRRKNFSQWYRSFQRKLLSHWLKFLRHVAITLVIQGPGLFVQNIVWLLSNEQRSASLALCDGNPLVTDEFPSQSASNRESAFMSWRHHVWSRICTLVSYAS